MQNLFPRGFRAALTLLGLAACTDLSTPTELAAPAIPTPSVSASENGKHIVVFDGDDPPADFDARVASRGGSVDEVLGGAGLAIVSGLTEAGAASLALTDGIQAVAVNRIIDVGAAEGPGQPEVVEETAVTPEVPAFISADPMSDCNASRSSRSGPAMAKYYLRQWNLCAIHGYAAWDADLLGDANVKVFLLDTGIDYENPDLEGLVDPNLSISLVPKTSIEYGRLGGKHPYMDFHSHGTGVASLISSNAKNLAGVTQKTTLVSVKVLDRTRRGTIDVFLRGIYYAADSSADVIHFSFAFEGFNKADSTGQVAAFNKAAAYAHRKGAVMVVAAGNLSVDLDHNRNNWRVCNTPTVICVGATAPTAAAGINGGWTNIDAPATYTNFGRSTISVAGPGGNNAPNRRVWLTCSQQSLVKGGNPLPCAKGSPVWESYGTSFGAGATSGLAALLVSEMGHGRPNQIRSVIENSADDLGQRGTDPYYGRGRINVARAIAMLR